MNERIKELAEQAGYSKDYLEIGLPSNMEKFAELIVKECANIDFRRKVGLTADDHYEISKVIKQHFGVDV
jgi:hypothetical protein